MTHILYNPLSNGGHGLKGIEDVQAAFAAEHPQSLDITALDVKAFIADLSPEDKIILCGGDGTLHHLVNDLDELPPSIPIHIWRFGTGNDFMRDISPKGGEKTLLINEYIRHLPTAEFQGMTRRFVNGCSCGVDAIVCQKMEENRLHPRKSGYIATAISSFFRYYKPISGRVTVDGETRSYDKIWMAGALHGRMQGGGMKFAPQQDRSGDTLTSFVWHDTSALGTLVRFPFVIPGWHTGFAACDMRVGHEIIVELDEPTVIQLDGEILEGITGYTARK
ncbi:MAG: diacylglycerol/lipid kinase family protein [Oscillospiraceae bacterium]